MNKQKFRVMGMTCSSCVANVEKNVKKLRGVENAEVSLLTNSMTVTYDESALTDADIIKAAQDSGYNASLYNAQEKGTQQHRQGNFMQEELASMKKRVIYSIIILIVLMYVSMFHMLGLPGPAFLHGRENAATFAFTQFLLTLSIVYLNRNYFSVGFKTLFKGAPNMDTLIAIGSGAALVYGIYAVYKIGFGLGHGDFAMVDRYSMDLYFESAAMILTLITLGKYLETRSKSKTGEAIEKLMDLAPKTATIEREGIEQEVPVENVRAGDIVIVRPGQGIPVDGVIIHGTSTLDESILTGESIPVEKMVGDKVSAGVINKTGYFKMEARQVGEDTTLARMIRLVEEAGASKAPIAKLADKVASVFVPIVICIATISAVVWLIVGKPFEFAMTVGISVLVISCPCALGLATPVAIMVGTGKSAEHGILIKSAEALETACHTDIVVMDKTGTITQGKPAVTDVVTHISEEELVKLALSLEEPSEHPLAEAIVEYAQQKGISAYSVQDFNAIPGKGLIAKINGEVYMAGNIAMMQQHNIDLMDYEEKAQALAQEGKTPLYFAGNGSAQGIIAVMDIVKPSSGSAIKQLEDMGIEVIMLTGDNRITAEAIRKSLHINRVYSEVMPEDKERIIRELQQGGKKVAMIGDGINDAPALARADVGIAIGAGTDIAIESADIVLVKSDLVDAVTAIKLSKSVIRNIKQNLFWAFFYNVLGIPLAAGVFYASLGWLLNPMFAAAAMSLSSIFVVTNALRLKLFKIEKPVNYQNTIKEAKYGKEESIMKKEMLIEGMTCTHCSSRVEQALNAIEGVSAKVDLDKKTAYVEIKGDVSEDALKAAVTGAGYEVKDIKG